MEDNFFNNLETDHKKDTESERIVHTICKMCSYGCGMKAYVQGGKLIKVTTSDEHPFGKRHCPRADSRAILEYVYSKDRITDPLMKINRKWKKVTWNEAFDFIVTRLNILKNNWGPKSLVFHVGNPFISTVTEKVGRRFCDVFGTPNFTSGSSFCFYSRRIGHSLVINHKGATAFPSFKGTKCCILWGGNPFESMHVATERILQNLEQGSKLIVIDPRRIELAKKADIFVQIRPGTDCALALGLLHVIIGEKLYDHEFVKDWTNGFDRLVEHVKEYTPEVVEKITWVPSNRIVDIARAYATNKPASISEGIKLDHGINGVHTHRAIAIMIAICGNMDVVGGNVYSEGMPTTNLRIPERTPYDDEGIGREYPIFNRICKERPAMCIPDGVLEKKPYPIKGMIVQGTNPVAIWPETSKTIETLKNLEFLMVVDLFMTSTAELADIILPCASFLEDWQMKGYGAGGLSLMTIGQKVIDPVGNSMPDWQILQTIMKKMGYGEYFPWRNTKDLIEYLLRASRHSLKEFLDNPGGLFHTKFRSKKYINEGFHTPSGKIEIYSAYLKELGYDPLPVFKEPPESPLSNPDLAEKYPLIMTTGAKSRYYTHSQFRNIAFLREKLPEPFIEINPKTARDLEITEDEKVSVSSPRGSINIKARLTEDIHPKVVHVMHGWEESNINYLTDSTHRDPISSYPHFTACLCRVDKIESCLRK